MSYEVPSLPCAYGALARDPRRKRMVTEAAAQDGALLPGRVEGVHEGQKQL